MVIIGNTLVSDEVLMSWFRCELSICKGACCVDGDFGAPLDEELMPIMKNYLSAESLAVIEARGPYTFYDEPGTNGTTLMPEGPCVFMVRDESGIALCGFEKAWREGAIPFRKPLSCHLYPIRVVRIPQTGATFLNYDRWEICKPACASGMNNRVPLYKFLKEAIIRGFGAEFYEELEAAAAHLNEKHPQAPPE
jgi:hypothetical protein